MNSSVRNTVFGLIGAFAGFGLSGCFAEQPQPECNVITTAAGLGIGPYLLVLEPVDGTGECAGLDHAYAGLQRFRTNPIGGPFRLGVKTSLVADPWLGYSFVGDVDPSNNCVNEEDCQGEADPAASCVVAVSDGGYELTDGTPVADDGNGGYAAMLADGGTIEGLDVENECTYVEEPVYRVDPTDPDGKNIIGIGTYASTPVGGTCAASDFTGGAQEYQEEVIGLPDGGTETLPAERYQVEWSDFNVRMSANVQGTAFTANMKFTQGSCVANYKALGVWPAVECTADVDCDPNPDLDAGRVFGSGINPAFKSTCNTTIGYCTPTVDVTTLE